MIKMKDLAKKVGLPASTQEVREAGGRAAKGASSLVEGLAAKAKKVGLSEMAAAMKLAKHKVDPLNVLRVDGLNPPPSLAFQEQFVRSLTQPVLVLVNHPEEAETLWPILGAHFGAELVIVADVVDDVNHKDLADGVVVVASAGSVLRTDLVEFHIKQLSKLSQEEGWV